MYYIYYVMTYNNDIIIGADSSRKTHNRGLGQIAFLFVSMSIYPDARSLDPSGDFLFIHRAS